MSEGRAFSVTADGLTYAGLEWGDPNGYPILALHGWLDNALSFSVIAPFLSEYRLIALDLSGQGLSDHRSPDATYHIWDDVPQLLSVVATLELDQLTVLGHSWCYWTACCRALRLMSPLWNSSCSRNVIIAGCQNISPALLKISRGSSVRGCHWVSQRAAPNCWRPERLKRPRMVGHWLMIPA
jgi:hypothetical protein